MASDSLLRAFGLRISSYSIGDRDIYLIRPFWSPARTQNRPTPFRTHNTRMETHTYTHPPTHTHTYTSAQTYTHAQTPQPHPQAQLLVNSAPHVTADCVVIYDQRELEIAEDIIRALEAAFEAKEGNIANAHRTYFVEVPWADTNETRFLRRGLTALLANPMQRPELQVCAFLNWRCALLRGIRCGVCVCVCVG